MYEQVAIQRTVYGGGENLLIQGSVQDLPEEIRKMEGQVQFVYVDPPFMTGEIFKRKRPYGEKGWKKGTPCLTMEGYVDRFSGEEEYLAFVRQLISAGRELLRPEGVFCLHLDWRMSAHARILCDQLFGRERFLNEIIWGYESGGRSKKFFPRKHDTILMYARSEEYHFDLSRVPLPRGENRKNHLARGVDEEGRSYSYIKSGGKEYRYYDDDPVYPGDVWMDIGFLQQKDPERTGYPTQKPRKLLERLMKPVVQPGDWVADLCCGSGTTLEAAEGLGCRYMGLDLSPEAIPVCLARLKAEDLSVVAGTDRKPVPLLAEYDAQAGRLRMGGLALTGDPWPEGVAANELIEAWETGRMEGDTFIVEKRFQRSFQYPALIDSIATDPGRMPDLMVTDAAGVRRAYRWKKENGEEVLS